MMNLRILGSHHNRRLTLHDDMTRAGAFVVNVKHAFTFLIMDYGFSVVETVATFVRYESPAVFVNVYHGRGSHEIGLELGLLDDVGKLFSWFHLMELVCLQDDEACQWFRAYYTTDPMLIKAAVESLAASLKQYGDMALHGDGAVFTALRQARMQSKERYARELRESRARARGNDAWNQRAYHEVSAQFGGIESALSPSEEGKLRYARKMLAKTEHS